MPATVRLIVMMEQEEKAALEAQADAAEVSTGRARPERVQENRRQSGGDPRPA